MVLGSTGASFARTVKSDAFVEHHIPSTAKWEFAPEGQHIELGIAEMNLMLLLGAAGLSHSLWGNGLSLSEQSMIHSLQGVGCAELCVLSGCPFHLGRHTFWCHTCTGRGAHQSIGTPLIGMAQDGLAAFEPAFADELEVIMEWSFDYLQRDGEGNPDERTWLRDETGGSVYLRLSTNPIEQPGQRRDDAFRQGAIDGGYWLRKPGPNCDLDAAYQGAVAPEAIKAAGIAGEAHRDIGVLAVTSADRLNAGWSAAQRMRLRGNTSACSYIETLLSDLPAHAKIITVIDGHPATLSWIGSVLGHQTIPLELNILVRQEQYETFTAILALMLNPSYKKLICLTRLTPCDRKKRVFA